jgi:hypothetical protein
MHCSVPRQSASNIVSNQGSCCFFLFFFFLQSFGLYNIYFIVHPSIISACGTRLRQENRTAGRIGAARSSKSFPDITAVSYHRCVSTFKICLSFPDAEETVHPVVDPAARFLVTASGNRGWHGESTRTVFIHEIKPVT